MLSEMDPWGNLLQKNPIQIFQAALKLRFEAFFLRFKIDYFVLVVLPLRTCVSSASGMLEDNEYAMNGIVDCTVIRGFKWLRVYKVSISILLGNFLTISYKST